MNRSADDDSPLKHTNLRAPENHGATYQRPDIDEIDSTWQQNLQAAESNFNLKSGDLTNLRELGRRELVEAARAFSPGFIDSEIHPAHPGQIILAGHQPTLFHPGVWYKNFVLSNLGQRFDCHAVNLIIDNDICESTDVKVPQHTDGEPQLIDVAYDDLDSIVPFEERQLINATVFDSFATRVVSAMHPSIRKPLINELWPLVPRNRVDDTPELAMARGRHALEFRHGLRTLEIPISRISGFRSFAIFFHEIISRLEEFVDEHNRLLQLYRQVNRIRSRVHPVPALTRDGPWLESPFWIWQKRDPYRRSLFCRKSASGWCLSDRRNLEFTLPDSEFSDSFLERQRGDVRIRPKALMTTLFSRLVLSDLFIHGIGGAKYDQLTDQVAQHFLGADLPCYLTVTATMKLDRDEDLTIENRLKTVEEQLRRMEFHPEKFIDPEDAEAALIAARKRQWTDSQRPPEDRKQQHQQIELCNQQLQSFIRPRKLRLIEQRDQLAERRSSSQMLGSREFSYCLFEETLPGELAALARPWSC